MALQQRAKLHLNLVSNCTVKKRHFLFCVLCSCVPFCAEDKKQKQKLKVLDLIMTEQFLLNPPVFIWKLFSLRFFGRKQKQEGAV